MYGITFKHYNQNFIKTKEYIFPTKKVVEP